ncbi:hypothetical protein WMY93_029313 [Mugilogobius chulae]|uniref:Uncharacterized protein n=1 Tax=Mugilogobius chulae TaxID=88201 RepID=A0AAW0MV17_9GOBI
MGKMLGKIVVNVEETKSKLLPIIDKVHEKVMENSYVQKYMEQIKQGYNSEVIEAKFDERDSIEVEVQLPLLSPPFAPSCRLLDTSHQPQVPQFRQRGPPGKESLKERRLATTIVMKFVALVLLFAVGCQAIEIPDFETLCSFARSLMVSQLDSIKYTVEDIAEHVKDGRIKLSIMSRINSVYLGIILLQARFAPFTDSATAAIDYNTMPLRTAINHELNTLWNEVDIFVFDLNIVLNRHLREYQAVLRPFMEEQRAEVEAFEAKLQHVTGQMLEKIVRNMEEVKRLLVPIIDRIYEEALGIPGLHEYVAKIKQAYEAARDPSRLRQSSVDEVTEKLSPHMSNVLTNFEEMMETNIMKLVALALILAIAGCQALSLQNDVQPQLDIVYSFMDWFLDKIKAGVDNIAERLEDEAIRNVILSYARSVHDQIIQLQMQMVRIVQGAMATIDNATIELRSSLKALITELEPMRVQLNIVINRHIDEYKALLLPIIYEYHAKQKADLEAWKVKLQPVMVRLHRKIEGHMEETLAKLVPIYAKVYDKVVERFNQVNSKVDLYLHEYQYQIRHYYHQVRAINFDEKNAVAAGDLDFGQRSYIRKTRKTSNHLSGS